MPEETKTVTDLINELVTKNTFSLDAVAGIEALKMRASRVEEDLRTYKSMYRDSQNANEAQGRTIEDLTKRLGEIEAREKKMTDLERNTAVAEARSSVYAEVVSKMFANRIVRESVQTGTWVAEGSNGNHFGVRRDNTENTAREEG